MSFILAAGPSESIYLRMNPSGNGIIQYSIGHAPGVPSWSSSITSWPVSISNTNASPAGNLNVIFTENLSISNNYGNTSGYFIAHSSYITIDGAGYNINITNIAGYPGFMRNGQSNVNGKENIIVKNLNANVTESTLSTLQGWICQSYFGKGALSNYVTNCTTNGDPINRNNTAGGGGIAGAYAGSCGIEPGYSAGAITFRSCACSGSFDATSNGGGGIAGDFAGTGGGASGRLGSATFINCTCTGIMYTADNVGGIAGRQCGSNYGSATITNCTYNSPSSRISNSGGGCGGIVGSSCGSGYGNVTINSCSVIAFIIGTSSGGFVGANAGSNYGTLTISNCINNTPTSYNFNGYSDNGGFCGRYCASGSGNVNIINCTNNGAIGSIYQGQGGRQGGFCGAEATLGGGILTFTDCINNGFIRSIPCNGFVAPMNNGADTASYIFINCTNNGECQRGAGFISGGGRNTSLTLTNCTNNGNITASQQGGLIGGLSEFGNATITNCKNTGNITGVDTGGLAGSYFVKGTFTNCINTGAIVGGGIIGSFAGYVYNRPDLNNGAVALINCANTGIISGNSAGGIVKDSAKNVTITNCYNTGDITGPNSGGIAGPSFGLTASANGSAAITNCYSTGAISGDFTGGIVGNNTGSTTYTINITNCYSLGNISSRAGGITYSCIPSNKVTISNCYSFGNVATAGSGIVPTASTQPLSLENCYVANNNWNDTTANANLIGDPTGIGIAVGQATTWTSMSANTPYLLSTFFSLSGNKTAQQIYTPDSIITTNNGSSSPGFYQPGIYSFANTSQSPKNFTANVYVIGGTTPTYRGYGYTTYTITNINGGLGRPITATINGTTGVISYILPYACFLENTKILCFENNKEVYRPVQSLRKGDLVKTIYNGYLPIHKIGTSTMYNPNNDDRISNRLYKCSKENYPALFEDLYITGCHSILVPRLTYEQGLITMASLGKLYVTDKHCRLMAWVDEKSEPYTMEGIYNIYHIALENKDYYMNYGIYANGLLVETCSKRYLTELSNMRILGEEDTSLTEDVPAEENIFHKMPRLVETC